MKRSKELFQVHAFSKCATYPIISDNGESGTTRSHDWIALTCSGYSR